MSGDTLIGWMTAGFGLITLAAVVAVLLRFRRRPIVWMLEKNARDIAFHRAAMAALASAMTAARNEGRQAEFDLHAASFGAHRRALRRLDPAADAPEAAAFAAL